MKGTAITFIGILLSVSMLAGCVTQKKNDAGPVEKTQVKSVEPASETMDPRVIDAVDVTQVDPENLEVTIKGNQRLVYTSIKQAFPFGIAVYLPETRLSESLEENGFQNRNISEIKVGYADEEKNTAKVEILLNSDMNYEVAENGNAITVALAGQGETVPEPMGQAVMKEPATAPSTPRADAMDEPASPVVIPDTTATMTNIEFNTMEDGTSDIVVQTNHPVRYDVDQSPKNAVYLNLYNTMIPDYHKRPLLTRYFKSAVEGLIPIQMPGKNNNSRVEITTRQQVPFRVVQNENTITLFFEPSTIEPPVFSKAKVKVDSGSQTRVVADQSRQKPDQPAADIQADTAAKKESVEESLFGPKKVYTGEKIKLDFYETDIKNVFRILKSVGGVNFAIDKGVEGKVTLSLEDPVPWDQVLDLILKMNDLGQKTEGNVIRIATIEQLKKEDEQLQATIAARRKMLEQQKSVEPLVTEYIPINYSDAQKDIQPHVSKILTKDRGKISVDGRTNMIILTDTQTKIDQAKEIIYRLDRVTPQIMIEAKVVEVTKNFSRELGLGLSLTKTQTAHSGRDRDFTVALNNPAASPVTAMSFNFYRLLGTDFLNLNAQLAASETKGDVKLVSSPRILTLDNKTAKIKQGLEYPYQEQTDDGISIKFKNIDLLLEVTPHVTPDKRIAMTVFITKNDVDSITNGVPSISTNEAETELLVNDNDTIIIGGIRRTTDNQSTSGTPVLSGIPILGRLFRTDTTTDRRNELLIFLTPSIVQLEQKRNIISTMN